MMDYDYNLEWISVARFLWECFIMKRVATSVSTVVKSAHKAEWQGYRVKLDVMSLGIC